MRGRGLRCRVGRAGRTRSWFDWDATMAFAEGFGRSINFWIFSFFLQVDDWFRIG